VNSVTKLFSLFYYFFARRVPKMEHELIR